MTPAYIDGLKRETNDLQSLLSLSLKELLALQGFGIFLPVSVSRVSADDVCKDA